MNLADRLPRIDPEDRRSLLAAAGGFMCVCVANLLVRIVGDSLFLSVYGRDSLAFVYLGTAGIVSLLSFLFGVFAGRIPLQRLIIASAGVLVLLTLATRLALELDLRVIRLAAYLLADLTIHGTMLLFWSFFAQLFDSRKAKRFIGFVGGAGTLACLVAAMAVGPFNAWFGAPNLLLVVAALVAGFAWTVRSLAAAQERVTRPARRAESRERKGYRWAVLRNPNVRGLVLLVSVATITTTLIDFQFKAAAQAAFEVQELPAFFGNFYAAANVVVLVTQLLLLTWLLRRGGLLLCLCLLPGTLFLTSAWTLFGPEFIGIVASRFAVQVMIFTIDSAALHVLYLGVRKQTYSQARAFVDGICKPVAIGLTGALLFLSSGMINLQGLALFGMIAAALWLGMARGNYRIYLAALLEGLRAKLIYPGERRDPSKDPAIERYAREELLKAPAEDLPYLLTLMSDFEDIDLTPELLALLAREEPEVKVAALERLRPGNHGEDLEPVLAHQSHPEAAVRRAAILAASALGGTQVSDALQMGLKDPEPEVRAEAAVALMQLGDLNGLMRGVETLKVLMESSDPTHRRAIARPLSEADLAGRYELMRRLLEDPDRTVQRSALEACVRVPDPRLVPAVLNHLNDPGLAAAATDVLIAAGPHTLKHLGSLSPDRLVGLVGQAPVLLLILAKVGGSGALAVVRRLIEHMPVAPDLADCYRRLVSKAQRPDSGTTALVLAQLGLVERRRSQLRSSENLPHSEFFRSSVEAALRDHLQSTFLLLEVLVEGVDMQVLCRTVLGGSREARGRALDILESLLPPGLRREVLRAVDPVGTDGKHLQDPFAETLVSESLPAILAGAVYASGRSLRRDLTPSIDQLLEHPSPLCRETALDALRHLEDPEVLRDALRRLEGDSDAAVSRLVRAFQQRHNGRIPMITVERVLFLRHVPLFAHMNSSELSALARIAREEIFTAGSEIIAEGELGETAYLVVDGEVVIYRGNTELGILTARDHFGEMAILDGEPRSASATARTDCLLLSISRRDFNDLLAQYNQMARAVIATLNERLRNTLALLDTERKEA